MRGTSPEGGPAATSSAPSLASSTTASATAPSGAFESGAPSPPAADACRTLPIHLGGTVEDQTFEGRVAVATGHDPEQGDGTYAVLVLDAPVCAAYAVEPQRELLLGAPGGQAKWEALGARWNGQRVRVTGSVRSLDIYIGPMRHFLLFASRIDPAP